MANCGSLHRGDSIAPSTYGSASRRPDPTQAHAEVLRIQRADNPDDITNIYLNEVEYRVLEALGGNEILKYRYVIDIQHHQFGIDVFGGRHEGLILAEVEGESEVALKQIALPAFAVRDVTGDPFFTGGALAIVSEADLRRRLAEEAG